MRSFVWLTVSRELLGEGSVSMRRLADRLGIKAPSLYKHLRDKGALEAALISDAFLEAAERFERAATRARRRLPRFALEHPTLPPDVRGPAAARAARARRRGARPRR